MTAKFPDRLEDVFQDEIVKRFADVTHFKRFARSKHGLCLDEHDIQQIEEDNDQVVEDQKMKMLNLWRAANGEMATDWQIRFLVERYYRIETGDQSDTLKLDDMFKIFKKHKLSPRGHVYLGEEDFGIKTTRSCAIKFVEFDEETEREGNIFSKLPKHENIISIERVGVHKSFPFDYIYIAMELGWTRNLRDVFTENKEHNIPFDEANAKNLTKQLFKGLSFIHGNKVIHRDMKPENVLVSDDNTVLKIADFGVSKPITKGNETVQTFKDTGTEGYRAQETYEDVKISPASDVYSTGIIFGEIFSDGHHPFGEDPDLWKYNIKNDVNLDLSHVNSSNRAEITQLIRKTLCHDPIRRPTAKFVLENDALKRINPSFSQRRDVIKYQAVSEVPDSSASHGNILLEQKAEKKRKELHAGLLQRMLQSSNIFGGITEMLKQADMSDAKRLSTSTGKEIIIYNPSSQRFEIYRIIDESLKKFGETKKFSIDLPIYFHMAAAKKYLYAFDIVKVSRIKYLDLNAEWSQISNPFTFNVFKVAVLTESIYVFGRSLESKVLIGQKYDEDQDRWILVNPIKTGRKNALIVATNDHIYCIGGVDDTGFPLGAIERFDPITQEWQILDVILPRNIKPDALATSVEHRIYIYGGDTDILCWDTEINSWSELNISDRESFVESEFKNIVTLNNEVILIGTCNSDVRVVPTLTSEMWKNFSLINQSPYY